MNILVVWDVIPYILRDRYQRFKKIRVILKQGQQVSLIDMYYEI
jgi:hypothetical protein